MIGPSIAATGDSAIAEEADGLSNHAHRAQAIAMNMQAIYSQPRSADEDHALILRHARERLTSSEK
ncbi:hypothetical protein [Lysobacter sp. Root690]|uniref:hypothetical protein n=1 Tax=Lysobacter sp. Root690 TaxID=1736588 RepID=UPI001F1D67E9|nr:hypothetical protein [Lysobacter sp. Root690]